jgi:3-phenylpropionate/trans-cinnamate dioxygenase ferredoxin subunit
LALEFVRFCESAELPNGEKKALKLDDRWILVVHAQNRLFAVSGMCSHQQKPLWNGRVRHCKITCPVHGARFDLETGAALDLPATQPIDTFEVRERDGWIEVAIETSGADAI